MKMSIDSYLLWRKYQKIKKVVAKWKADNFTDGFSWDCMKEIADIVDDELNRVKDELEPTTENCESCKYYGSHHEVCNYCYKCSLWTVKEPTTKKDLALIHTEGLDEEIRCTMCTNSMKSDRGCDGSCVVNSAMYKNVMDAIEKRIQPTTKNDLGVDCVSRQAIIDEMEKRHAKGDYITKGFVKNLPSLTPQEPKIKVLERDEAMKKLGAVDIYQASAWVTLLNDLEYLGLKICEVEE